jgi:5-(hydroxymethyl)furfural/furfural oxidase
LREAALDKTPIETDVLIVGGGSAGCALAARLSEDSARKVVLVEAGPDVTEDSMPEAIRSAYPSRAFFTRDYFHPELFALLGDAEGMARERVPARYEQARVLGGGSTINGLVANRGAPDDYDEWAELGADGWAWNDVLPYFRKLERDLDFDGAYHGKDGPIPIRRLARSEISGFVERAFEVFRSRGYEELADQNADWRDGVMQAAISVNEAGERASAATCYLTPQVRARPNLTLITEAEVDRLLVVEGAVGGAELQTREGRRRIRSRETILCAGAIATPTLLLRNGIGPADELSSLGIEVVRDLSGVGRNLHEHPALGLSCFVRRGHRHSHDNRHHTQAHFRFSSGMEGCPQGDMKVALLARSAWHAVGAQLATFYLWVNKPYSKGRVALSDADAARPPLIDFRLLSDRRDMRRMLDAFRLIVDIARDPGFDAVRHEVFPTIYSDRVRSVSRPTRWNAIQTAALAALLDYAGFARAGLIRRLIAPVDLDGLLAEDRILEEYLDRAVVGVWHPTGTCRMGRADDPDAVTDSAGRVHGVAGLRVCDASLMPTPVRANTNLPTIMVAERIADLIRAR